MLPSYAGTVGGNRSRHQRRTPRTVRIAYPESFHLVWDFDVVSGISTAFVLVGMVLVCIPLFCSELR